MCSSLTEADFALTKGLARDILPPDPARDSKTGGIYSAHLGQIHTLPDKSGRAGGPAGSALG
jgi:hypothetical protein